MNKAIYILICVTLLCVIPLVSSSLGTFKQNELIQIRVLANCSTINMTEVTIGNITYIINKQMTNLGGQTFNYTFANTSNLGTYTYSWYNPCIDCSQGDCGNSFEITATGYKVTSEQTTIMFFIVGVIFLVGLLFFIFGMRIENPAIKLFCLCMTVLLIVFLVGYIVSMANITISEFTGLTNGFQPIYIIFITLLTAGGVGLVVYLIAFGMISFSKFRGLRE